MRYDYTLFISQLGSRVKQLRRERGLTHRALVMEHNFHLTHLQRIEGGKGLSIPTLLRLAEALNVSAADLIDGLGICTDLEEGATHGKLDCK